MPVFETTLGRLRRHAYAWITRHRDSYPVALMCEVLDVSGSGYYDSVDRPQSPRAQALGVSRSS